MPLCPELHPHRCRLPGRRRRMPPVANSIPARPVLPEALQPGTREIEQSGERAAGRHYRPTRPTTAGGACPPASPKKAEHQNDYRPDGDRRLGEVGALLGILRPISGQGRYDVQVRDVFRRVAEQPGIHQAGELERLESAGGERFVAFYRRLPRPMREPAVVQHGEQLRCG